MKNSDDIYSFVFKGLLTEDALDVSGRKNCKGFNGIESEEIQKRLSLELLDKELVARASRMAVVYTAIASFENSVRRLISTVLLEQVGADWWQTAVPQKTREKAEARRSEELKIRWHAPRGDEPLNYTELGDLVTIINQNWDKFEPFMRTLEWTKQLISSIERSRNVIMHSGELELEDIERIGGLIRDWIRQVGG